MEAGANQGLHALEESLPVWRTCGGTRVSAQTLVVRLLTTMIQWRLNSLLTVE